MWPSCGLKLASLTLDHFFNPSQCTIIHWALVWRPYWPIVWTATSDPLPRARIVKEILNFTWKVVRSSIILEVHAVLFIQRYFFQKLWQFLLQMSYVGKTSLEDELTSRLIGPTCTLHFFFFHWHYSPLWSLACRAVSFHFFLSATNSLHLLTPSTWRSLSTSSFHPFLGLPLLVSSSSWVQIFLSILSSSILSRWPNQLILCPFIHFTVFSPLLIFSSSQSVRLFHFPFSYLGPYILLNIFRSKISRTCSSFFVNIHASAPYDTTGLILPTALWHWNVAVGHFPQWLEESHLTTCESCVYSWYRRDWILLGR